MHTPVLSPSMSSDVIIDSFVVVVIGGLGSLAGAFAAALVLGLVQSLGAVWLPDTFGYSANPSATAYILQAVPGAPQAGDTACATLTLNQAGAKGATGTTPAGCWR